MGDVTAAPAATDVGCPTPRPTSWGIDQVVIGMQGSAAREFHEGGAGGAVYFFGLLYCFMGVAVVSDVFMAAIERITSEEHARTGVRSKPPGRERGGTSAPRSGSRAPSPRRR